MIQTENIVATTKVTESVLGHLYWFNVGKMLIKVEELEQKLKDSGLDNEWLPNRIRSVDAFRRATKEVQTRKPTSNPKIFKNYLVREVYSDKEAVQRHLVVETVDQDDKRLGYESETAIIRLDKKNNTIIVESDNPEAFEIAKDAEKKFYLYRDHYSSQHIRVMVSKILSSLAPIPMRENGVIYFVPNKMTQGLINLVSFINSLENSDAFKVPVINSEDERSMVAKKLGDYMERLLDQCRNSEGMRKDQLKMLVEETNNTIQDYRHYKQMVTAESEEFEQKILSLRSEVLKIIRE